MKKIITILLTLLIGQANAQEIAGRVLDEKREPFVNVTIRVYQGGILKGGNVTDYDGNYVVKPLDPGYYDVLAVYAGYDSMLTTAVVVAPGQRTTLNLVMQKHIQREKQILIARYKKPIVHANIPASPVLTKDEIAALLNKSTGTIIDPIADARGIITGRVLNEKKEPLTNAAIWVYQGGIQERRIATNFDGNYSIVALYPGYYDVLAIYPGYDSILITGVVVVPEQRTMQNFALQKHMQGKKQILITPYKKPLVDVNKPATLILEQEDIHEIPVENVKDIVEGTQTVYLVDGVRVVASNKPIFCNDVAVQEIAHDRKYINGKLYIIDQCEGLRNRQIPITPVNAYKIPLINYDNPSSHILTREQLDNMPAWSTISDLVSLFPGVYQRRRGDDVSVFGGRMGGNGYILDGVR